MFKRDMLTGIDEIRKYLEVSSDLVVLDWRSGYDLPIKKEGGIWTARKSDLKKWKKEHTYLTEIPPEPRELVSVKVVKERFGLLKFEKIKTRR